MKKTDRREEEPKRLLFVLQYFYPDVTGFSQMLADLTEYLSETGKYRCTVLAGSTVRSVKRWARLPRHLGNVQIRRVRTLATGKRTFVHRLAEYSSYYVGVIAHLATVRSYDAVVCFTTPPLIGLAVIAGLVFSRLPLIYYVQDLYPELLHDMGFLKSPWLIRKLSIVNRLILRRADKVVTIGGWMAKKLHRNYGLSFGSIAVIENWSQELPFIAPPEADPFTILYSGNVGLAHDFSLLPGLLNELELTDRFAVAFSGSGRGLKGLQLTLSKRTGARCSFSGYVERSELGPLLSSAHLFLLAQSEATVGDIVPSKFYSYLAAGRPILFLGTAKSEIGETILQNGIGIVVECDKDIAEASARIRRYSSRGPDYLKACEGARRLYDETMGLDRSAARFESVVDEVVAT